jgi:hypothetical protein
VTAKLLFTVLTCVITLKSTQASLLLYITVLTCVITLKSTQTEVSAEIQ